MRARVGSTRGSAIGREPSFYPSSSAVRLAVLAALGATPLAHANTIVTDGRTDTSLDVNGSVTDIRTGTVRGKNAFNSFRHFRVIDGNTVNLHLPGGTKNLINLVHDSKAVINGTLNSLLDGKIGGHVVFADPHGIVVGAQGVLNVGSLLLATPTQDFMDRVISQDGTIDDDAVSQLLDGEAPQSSEGIIDIGGTVNAAGAIGIAGTDVAVTGSLRSASPAARQALFEASVNTEGLDEGVDVSVSGGQIAIVGTGDVTLAGDLDVAGADAHGGTITVRAGRDVVATADANLDASGTGVDADGGVIDIWADRDGELRQGAQLSATAGDSGDGGFIEFSAQRRVTLAPVKVDVSGAGGGEGGLFYVDPEHITLAAGDYDSGATAPEGFEWNGGNAWLEATESIELQNGARVISSGGDITLEAPVIDLLAGSELNADSGDIFLKAVRQAVLENYGAAAADLAASITVNGILRGANIDIQAIAEVTAEPAEPASVADIVGKLPTSLKDEIGPLPDIGFAFAAAEVDAIIDIGSQAQIEATGDVTLHAKATRTATATAGADGEGLGASAAFGWLGGETRVSVAEGAQIAADGALELRAESHNTLKVAADTAVSGLDGVGLGGAVALGFIDTTTEATLDAGSNGDGTERVSAGSVSLLAHSTDDYQVAATTRADAGGSVGIAAAVLDASTVTRARLAGALRTTGDVRVVADSTVTAAISRAVTGAAPAEGGGSEGDGSAPSTGDWSSFLSGRTEKADNAAENKVAADDGGGGAAEATPGAGEDGGLPLDFGSAMSLVWLDDTTEALIAADAEVPGGGGTPLTAANVTVAARREVSRLANQAVSNTASTANEPASGGGEGGDSGAGSGGGTGGEGTGSEGAGGAGGDTDSGGTPITISAALAFGNVNHTTRAYIGDDATIEAERLGIGAGFQLSGAVDWGEDGAPGSLADLEAADAKKLQDWTTSHAAAAAAGGTELSLAGAASVLLLDTNVEAGVGTNADITISGSGDDWSTEAFGDDAVAGFDWQDALHVQAAAHTDTLSLVGNSSDGDGVGIGGGVNWDARRTRVSSSVGAGTVIRAQHDPDGGEAAPGMAVTAERGDTQITAAALSGESGGTAGLGAALALGQLDAAAAASVDASLQSLSDITVRTTAAGRNAVLAASRINGGDLGLAATLALANVDLNDRAQLHTQPDDADNATTVAGDVTVAARSVHAHEARATAEAVSGVGLGIAAAIADVDATGEAVLGGASSVGGAVTVLGTLASTASTVIAETTVKGEDGGSSAEGGTEGGSTPPVAAKDGGSTSYVQNRADGKAATLDDKAAGGTGGDGSSSADIKLGAALALSDVERDATARIDTDANITTPDDLAVVADLRDQAVRTQARAGAVSRIKNGDDSGTDVAGAGAVALDFRDNSAEALVGENVTLTAARIGIDADAALPLSAELGWSDFLKLQDIYKEFKGTGGTPLTDKLRKAMRGYASATVKTGADDVGFSGSVNFGQIDTNARAWIGEGSTVTATGSFAEGEASWSRTFDGELTREWDDTLAVTARTDTRSLEVAGNLNSLFAGNEGTGSRALLGGSFNWVDRGGNTIAGIGADTKITAQTVGVHADRFDQAIVITPGSGKGAGIAGTGMVSFARIAGLSHASLSNSADVTTDALNIDALHELSLWTVAGALARGENAGVGMALAVNDLQADTRAWIGRNDDDAPTEESAEEAGVIHADSVAVTAASRGSVASAAVAGAEAAESSGEGKLNQTAAGTTNTRTQTAQNNATDATGKADGTLEDTQKDAKDQSAWSGDDGKQGSRPANGDSSKSNKGSIGLSVAGGAVVNLGDLNTQAEIDGATIRKRNAEADLDVTVRAITDADMLGFAGGAALTRGGGSSGGFKAALAGSLAFNHLENSTRALLTNSTLTGARDVAVEAMTAGDQIAAGVGIALSTTAKGLGVAGSASIGYVANTTEARIAGSELLEQQGDVGVIAYDRTRIANGGGALSVGGKGGVGAAVTVGLVENDLDAVIQGGVIDGAASVDVSALSGTLVLGGAAMASAVTGSSGAAASGSAVYNQVANTVTARIYDGAVLGKGEDFTKVGAVTVRAAGTEGVAHLDDLIAGRDADVDTVFAIADLLDPSRGEGQDAPADGAPEAGSEPGAGYDTGESTDLANPVETGEAVVGIAGSISVGGAASLGLSFVGNFIDSTYEAAIDGAQVSSTGAVDVSASDKALIAGLAVGASANSGKFAGMGSVTVNRITSEAKAAVGNLESDRTELDAASLRVAADKGADIYALAGSVAFSGKAGVGLSVGYNEIDNGIDAGIRNAKVTLTGDSEVAADSEANIYSAAISGAASGGVAMGGSVNINRIGQTVNAEVHEANVTAAGLDVHAGDVGDEDGANIWALAGDIKGGGKAAVGVSLATNFINSAYTATVDDSALTLTERLDLRARSAGNIRTLGVSGGGGGKLAAGAAVATGDFQATTSAMLNNSSVEGSQADLLISAADESQIQTFSASLQVGGFAGAAGAATVNTMNNTVNAGIDGVPDEKLVHGRNVVVDARSEGDIGSIAMGAAGGGKVGLSGSVVTSILKTTTQANIGNGADVLAEGNVGVFARSDDAIGVAAGSVGIGGVAVGAAGSVTVNVMESETEASITGAATRVRAKQGAEAGGALEAGTGHLADAPSGNPFAEIFEGDSEAEPGAEDFAGYSAPNLGGETREVGGVVVDALSLQQADAALASVGVSANVVKGGAGLAGAVNTTVMAGETRALVEDATIGDADDRGTYGDLTVVSGHHSYGTSVVLGLAAGSEGAMGATTVDVFEGRSVAAVRDAAVHIGGDVDIDAVSSRGLLGVSAGAAVGTYVGAAGSGGVTVFSGETLAEIIGAATVHAADIDVRADSSSRQELIAAGFAGSGLVAAAGTFAVAVSENQTTARIGDGEATGPEVYADGDVTVDADSSTEIRNTVASAAAAGAVALAGAVSTPVILNKTTASINDAKVDADGTVTVAAKDMLSVTSGAGGGALSIQGGSGAAGINIGVVKSQTGAEIVNSDIDAAAVTVTAERDADLDLDTYLVAGSAFGAGLSGGLGVLVLGESLDNEISDEADGSLDKELGSGDGDWLAKGSSFANRDQLAGEAQGGGTGDASVDGSGGDLTEGTLSEEDRAAYGSKGSIDLDDAVYGAAADSTSARIVGGDVDASGDVTVTATDRTSTSNTVGSFAVGGAVGAGGAVAVTQINSDVGARVNVPQLTAGSLTIDALTTNGGGGSAVDVRAYTGAAGTVGLGAAVAVGMFDGSVTAELEGEANVADGVTVQAEDEAEISAQGLGAQAGAAAAGVVVAVADRATTVAAGINGKLSDASQVTVKALANGASHAKSISAAAGLGLAAQAGGAFALEQSSVSAELGKDADLTVTSLSLEAAAVPKVFAEAYGASVSGSAAIGAAVANARSQAAIKARILDGARVSAHNVEALAQALKPGSGASTRAKSVAGSGGLLVGANVTLAEAESSNTVTAALEQGALLKASGSVQVTANNNSRQDAFATGVSLGGVLALGAAVADASSDSATTAELNGRVEGHTANSAPTTVAVRAFGDEDNQAEAISGSGGIIAAAAARAGTNSNSDTRAYIHRYGAPAGEALRANNVVLDAHHITRFNGISDSFQASIAGLSGAVSDHVVTADVTAAFGDGAHIQAYNLVGSASNQIIKAESSDYNAQAASGGAFTGAAVGSYSDITQNTELRVGEDAVLEVIGDYRNPGLFDLMAYNKIFYRDRTRLDTGGAISVALAESKVDVAQSRADVTVGGGASLSSVGDINLSGYADVDLLTRANAKTYGLAAAAAGNSESRIDSEQNIVIEGGARLRSDGSIWLMAGRNRAGNSNDFEVMARTDVWNKTAVPITDIDALADVDQTANVRIDSGAEVLSVRDIHLLAVEGGIGSSGLATGTDLYRKALEEIGKVFNPDTEMSLDIRKGDSEWSVSRTVTVNGRAETGIQNHQYITIDFDESSGTGEHGELIIDKSDDVDYEIVEVQLGQNMQERLNELYRLREEYSGHPTLPAIYQAEINQIQKRLQDFGARLYDIKDHAGNIIGQSVESDVRVRMINLGPMLAAPGDIFVEASRLQGTGHLVAPGDATIDVINNSPYFLQIQGLDIPDYEAGRVVFNRLAVHSNAELNDRQGGGAAFVTFETAQSSPEPTITVRNTYNPNSVGGNSDYLAPDLYVVGDINNLRGTVSLSSAAGSVVAEGSISATDLEISAGRDFVLSYTPGFRHLGGDPRGQWKDFADDMQDRKGYWYTEGCSAGYYCFNSLEPDPDTGALGWVTYQIEIPEPSGGNKPTVAANNVYISGRYLNINGTIQSGIADWDLDLTELAGEITDAEAVFNARQGAGDHLFEIGSWQEGAVKAWWNAREDRIELDGIKVEGGYMELLGEIMSTGGGELKVLDGFGRINIDNETGHDLVIYGLDVGHGVEGTIRITDLGKQNSDGKSLVTLYKRVGNQIRVYDNETVDDLGTPTNLVETASGRSGVGYDPQSGLRYGWVAGQNKQEKEKRRWEESSATFFDLFSLSWLVPNDYSDYSSRETWNTDPRALLEGDYLAYGGNSREYNYKYEEVNTTGWTGWGNWKTDDYCSKHFIGCVERTYWAEATRQRGQKDFHTHDVRADHGISIEFIGYDEGLIDVTTDGGLLINGSIYNPEGATTLDAAFIEQVSNDAVIVSNDLTLIGDDGIGMDRAILMNVQGALTATALTGDIVLEDVGSGLQVNRIATNDGDVTVTTQGDLFMTGTGDAHVIRGDRISLTASQGHIGSASVAVNIDTADDNRGLINARAGGSIYLNEVSGDLRVETVDAAGDVYLRTAAGSIMDANTEESTDKRTAAELLALWNDMELTGSVAQEAADARVRAHKQAKEAEYRQYWRLRNVQRVDGEWVADDYDAGYAFQFDSDEAAAIKQRLGIDDLSGLEQARTDQYHALHAEFGSLEYEEKYTHEISQAEYDELTEGAVWTENELKYSIGQGLLSGGSDTDTRIEAPNVIGHNVTLEANGHSIGTTLADDLVIDLSQPLTDAERLAIASAEADDIGFDGDIVTVVQREDLDVHASGVITASANQEIYLGGEQDINVNDVESPLVRIKTGRSIIGSRADGPVITADEAVLEAGSGWISGSDGQALHIQVANQLTARADDAVRLVQHGGDLYLAGVFSGDAVSISVLNGGLFQLGTGTGVQADSLSVNTSGAVGELGNALTVELTDGFDGTVGGDLFLSSPAASLTLSDLDVAGLTMVSASGAIQIGGEVTSGDDADLSAGNRIEVEADARIESVAGDVAIIASELTMATGSSVIAADRATLEATDGDVTLGQVAANATDDSALRIEASGNIKGVAGHYLSTEGRAYLTAGEDIGQESQPLVLDAPRLALASGGNIWLDSRRMVTAATLDAQGNIDLTAAQDFHYQELLAGGYLDVQAAQTLSGDLARSTGEMVIDTHGADLDTVESETSTVLLSVTDNASVGSLDAAQWAELTVGGHLALQEGNTGTGYISVDAASAQVDQATAATTLDIVTTGDQSHGTLHSGGAMALDAGGNVDFTSLTGGATLVLNANGQVIGTTAAFQGAQNYGGAGDFDLGTVTSAAGDVVADVDGAFNVTTLRTPAGKIDIDAGSSAIADGESDETIDIVTTGEQNHGFLLAKDNLTAEADTDFRAYDLESVAGNIEVTADYAAVEFGDALSEIHIDTTGDQEHGLIDVDAGGYLHADDLIELTADGSIRFRVLRAGHDGDDPDTGGDVELNSKHGDLEGRLVKASRDIRLYALKGALSLERLDYGRVYTLEAGRDLKVGIGGSFDSRDGEIKAGRDIEITTLGTAEDAGDILLGGITAESGHVYLNAAGDIRVAAVTVGSVATSGAISAGTDVVAMAGGEIYFEHAVTAGGSVDLDAVDAILVDVIEAGGSIDSRSGGDTTGRIIRAGTSIDMVAGWQADGTVADADLLLAQAAAPEVRLRTADRLLVDTIETGRELQLQGRVVASDVTHTGSHLAGFVTGGNNDLADTVDLAIASRGTVDFARLYADEATIDSTATAFLIGDGWVTHWMALDTRDTQLYMNNVDPAARDVDVQIYEPDTRFKLRTNERHTWTDAYVSHYRAGYEVETPNFSASREDGGPEVGGPSVERDTQRDLRRQVSETLRTRSLRMPEPRLGGEPPSIDTNAMGGPAVNLGLPGQPAGPDAGSESGESRPL